jgi:acyl dehydratase
VTAQLSLANVKVGDQLPGFTMTFTRADLAAYAQASGDMNPIHRDEAFARSVGLPDVIAHGMLTMARAIKVVTDWVANPTAVLDYSVRMTRPVVVPNSAGVDVTFGGQVAAINSDGTVRIDLFATFEGQTVLGQARALVRLG